MTQPAPVIRPAHLSDASSIAALSIEVWVGTYLREGVRGIFADYVMNTFNTANTEALITDPKQSIFVSENADGIDGVVRVSLDTQGPTAECSNVEIATLYVQPRHHRKGKGKALLDAACAQALESGAQAVWLTTNSENTPAIEAYKAIGFAHVGFTDFMIKGMPYPNHVFTYDLGRPIT